MDSELQDILSLAATPPQAHPFWVDGEAPVLIYGTGTVGQDVHHLLTAKGVQVDGFVDHFRTEVPSLRGTAVFQPDDARLPPEVRSRSAIILAIHNREANTVLIVDRLRGIGYQHIVSLVDVDDNFPDELGDRYWLTNRRYYQAHESAIASALEVLADEVSRSLYLAVLRFRTTGDPSVLPAPDRDHQYVPTDIPAWEDPLRLIDCGAYDGDTLRALLHSGRAIQALAAFEPDPSNFSRLCRFVDDRHEDLAETYLWPCAVDSTTHQVLFGHNQGETSSISPTGEAVVQAVALDDVLFGFSPNLVKLDVEGAEQAALHGARNLIATTRPGLAICVYHRPSDLWEVPLLIERLAMGTQTRSRSDYQYFLRLHGYSTFDLVLYAVPEPRRAS